MSTATPRDRWVAAHCRILRRLFAVCGAHGARTSDAGLALLATSLAGQFSFHASLLFDLLATRHGEDPESLVAVPVPAIDQAIDELDAIDAPAPSCAVLARAVVPRLLSAVESAREDVDAAVDGPRARALTLIIRDLVDARSALERCCERLLAESDAVDDASAACAKFEAHLVAAGVVIGVVPS